MSLEWPHARRVAFALAVFLCGVLLVLLPLAGISVEYGSFSRSALTILLLLAISACFQWRGFPRLRAMTDVLCCGIALSLAAIAASYAAMAVGSPLVDAQLMAMDGALGFDWPAFTRFVDARPLLADALFVSYQSFAAQLICLPLLLALVGQAQRAYLTVSAYGLLCCVSSLVGVWYPALGAHIGHGVDPASLANVNAHFGYAFLGEFHAVRSGEGFSLSLERAAGILTFPSVHAAVALLCAWAGWSIAMLRYPLLLLNVAMAVSAISHGSHYLVDVIAGLGVAAMAISGVCLLAGQRPGAARHPAAAGLPAA